MHGLKPLVKVDIDVVVDLRPDKDGVTTIMIIIDAFSRWVNLYALKERTAENAGSKEELDIRLMSSYILV